MNQSNLISSDAHRLNCFPYAVGHGFDGVCLIIQMGPHRIMLDCGVRDFANLQNILEVPVELVFCTHAHEDHARGLQALNQAFPQIPIYASEVTAQLLHLNWIREPLASSNLDSHFCQALPWSVPVELAADLTIELFPAGHLPGSAAVLLTYNTSERIYKLFYTGDFALSNSRLVEGLSIEKLRGLSPDVLIIEGTYGTARYPRRRQQENQLMERINQALSHQHSVLLPLPSLGLGQEILMLLRSHHQFTGRDLDIWVDGSVALGCDAYLDLLSYFPASVQNFARHQPLFWDERVRPRMRRLTEEQYPQTEDPPCIILTDYQTDLSSYFHNCNHTGVILLPEQPRTEIGHDLEKIIAIALELGLEIETYFLANHCDGLGTNQLIHNLRPQHVMFIHGSPVYLADLTGLEELHNRYQLHSPSAGTMVEFYLGETFIQPTTPLETNYQGELNEQETGVNIFLPDRIISDPRWRNLADTGLVEARWQGEELVLRGVSQKELLNQSSNARISIDIDIDCCAICRYQRGQRCWNQASPLYSFRVTPEGYCPVFEPIEIEE